MDKASGLVSVEPGGERCLQSSWPPFWGSRIFHQDLQNDPSHRTWEPTFQAGEEGRVSLPKSRRGGHRGEPWKVRKCFLELTVSGNDGHDERTREEAAVMEEGQRQAPGLQAPLGRGAGRKSPPQVVPSGVHTPRGAVPPAQAVVRTERPATEVGPD